MLNWIWNYLFHDRGARLITGDGKVRVKSSVIGAAGPHD
jgi:hypothetical protein